MIEILEWNFSFDYRDKNVHLCWVGDVQNSASSVSSENRELNELIQLPFAFGSLTISRKF